MMRDTHPAAAATYHRLIGEMTGNERLEQAARLSSGVRALALAGLRRRHPSLSEIELRHRFAALCYGGEIARRVAQAQTADQVESGETD